MVDEADDPSDGACASGISKRIEPPGEMTRTGRSASEVSTSGGSMTVALATPEADKSPASAEPTVKQLTSRAMTALGPNPPSAGITYQSVVDNSCPDGPGIATCSLGCANLQSAANVEASRTGAKHPTCNRSFNSVRSISSEKAYAHSRIS